MNLIHEIEGHIIVVCMISVVVLLTIWTMKEYKSGRRVK